MGLGFRALPAGDRRDAWRARSREAGFDPEPDLPMRELIIDRDGRNLTVWLGPAEPGGPEEELYELDVVI